MSVLVMGATGKIGPHVVRERVAARTGDPVSDMVEQVAGRAPRTIEAFLDEALAPTGAGA